MAKFAEALINAMANECSPDDEAEGKFKKLVCSTEGAYEGKFSDKDCKTEVDGAKEELKPWGC